MTHFIFKRFLLSLSIITFLFSNEGVAQITVTDDQAATALAQKLAGAGITVQNAVLTCPGVANGIFTVTSSNLGLDSGIVLTTGRANTIGTSSAQTGINGPESALASKSNGAAGDPQLNTLANTTTHDACILEFDLTAVGDSIRFNYVFGSEEYTNATCGIYNDAFAFFISGPGIAGQDNMALVPGTNIPVTVNSVNNGVPGSEAGTDITNCTSLGPGSPFTSYYIDNTSGTTLTYKGITTVLSAVHNVTACSTYHLKLTIADGGNYLYDSGVFIEAGSLKTTSYNVAAIGTDSTSTSTYIVKGCNPGQILFASSQTKAVPQVIKFAIGGTAVNGTDYSQIADSVIIPANSNTVSLTIQGLPTAQNGVTSLILYVYSPYNCTGANTIVDSTELLIYDAPYVQILSHDTSVCQYDTIHIQASASSGLLYSWSPATGLDNPNILEPIAVPGNTITYILTGTRVGCTPVTDQFTITIQQLVHIHAGPDRVACAGIPFQFNVIATPDTQSYTYSWMPGTYLSDSTIPNPFCNPATNVTYIVKAKNSTCFAYDTVNVHVLTTFNLYNHDTAVCAGAVIPITGTGDPAYAYTWTPSAGVSDTNSLNTILAPDTSHVYIIAAHYPGCPDIVKTLSVDVQPNPIVFFNEGRSLCQYDTLHINPSISPAGYPYYTYSWSPATGINNPSSPDIIYSGDSTTTLHLMVSTPVGCTGGDSLHITVHNAHFATLAPGNDTAICPHDSVQLMASGGVNYQWSNNDFLTDTSIANPIAFPSESGNYTVYVTDVYGCKDTLGLNIAVNAAAVLALGDSITLYPGETYQMHPLTNCLSFTWFPPLGLSATDISNPVASPDVNTKYIVYAATDVGCKTVDSINVYVDPNTLLAIPNAFAPGGGPNNYLKIIKRGIATLNYLRIFNRWGNKVFETSNIDEGWDGSFNGNPQPLGVYIYEVEASTSTGSRFYKQGNITLLR